MIGLDTNVLVRYLAMDDSVQSPMAEKVIESALDTGNHLFISEVVLCELIWVLTSTFRFTRAEVVEIVQQLLTTQRMISRTRI